VPLLQELVLQCFCDVDPVVKLHTAKVLKNVTVKSFNFVGMKFCGLMTMGV